MKTLLHRGGHAIPIQKETEFFTVSARSLRDVQRLSEWGVVQEVRPVFGNVFKIKTAGEALDDVMKSARDENLVSHHAYCPEGDPSTRYYLTDLIGVTVKPKTRTATIESLLEKHGLTFVKNYPGMEGVFLVRVTKSAEKNPVKIANDLLEHPYVLSAEPNLINRFEAAYEPRDKYFSRQWHLHSKRGVELAADAGVEAPKAWDLTRGSRDVVVAVIDDGFDLSHPDLRGPAKVVFPKDYADGDAEPFPGREDYHGTAVAGVAIGEENGEGIVGVAPGCAFMPVRFRLNADDDTLWEIFHFTGARADVICCSWNTVPVYSPLPSILDKKFHQLTATGGPRGKGVVICFASGNFDAPVYQAGNANFQWLHPTAGLKTTAGSILNGFAAHPAVIAVSASTSQNRKAAYSNWGKEISLCAPSNNFHPLDPQLRLPGRSIWTSDNHHEGGGYSAGRYTGAFGGTSSATPLVAGIAALVRSANPELTAVEVRQILQETTDKITDGNADVILGHCKGNYDGNGHCEWFGYGKVNAARAVQRAKELVPPPPPEKVISEGIFIAAALVNPVGSDVWRETVTLFNTLFEEVNLDGWSLVEKHGWVQSIENLKIGARQFLTIQIKKFLLSNRGGSITLFNKVQQQVDRVTYTLVQAEREGETIRFLGG
jgi:subtilisin family serine protease